MKKNFKKILSSLLIIFISSGCELRLPKSDDNKIESNSISSSISSLLDSSLSTIK